MQKSCMSPPQLESRIRYSISGAPRCCKNRVFFISVTYWVRKWLFFSLLSAKMWSVLAQSSRRVRNLWKHWGHSGVRRNDRKFHCQNYENQASQSKILFREVARVSLNFWQKDGFWVLECKTTLIDFFYEQCNFLSVSNFLHLS